MGTTQETKACAGEINQTQNGLIVELQWKMKKRRLSEKPIESRTFLLTNLMKLGSDLINPDSVEPVLAWEEMTANSRFNTIKACKAFAKAFKLKWNL